MTDALQHRPSQTVRSVWVFKLDVPVDEIEAWKAPAAGTSNGKPPEWALRDALGVDALDPAGVEVFDAGDIAEYGLARYLTEANGFAEGMVGRDAPLLNGLRGPVVLIHSKALGETEKRLSPATPLSFIGRYDTRFDVTLPDPIETESAKGHLSPRTEPANTPQISVWPFVLMIGIVAGLVAILVFPKL